MQISQKFTGQDPETLTMSADGFFNNKNIYTAAEAGGWGCVNDDTPSVVKTDGVFKTCHDKNTATNTRHDW